MPVTKTRATRPPIRAAATFEALDQTHLQMLEKLSQLSSLIDRLSAEGIDDAARREAAQIHAFFADTSRAHHAAEEQLVFPGLLTSRDEELVQHVLRLQQDHGWIEEDWRELSPQLQAIAEGYSAYDLDFLRAATPIFTDLIREHIVLEESVVYPASREQHLGKQV